MDTKHRLRHLSSLQVQAALMVLCGVTAQVADEAGVPDLRDAYLILSGCWALLALLGSSRA